MELPERVERWLDEARSGSGRVIVLTGAGVSAESGIPTFRGPEGYWTVGSRVYHPMELATYSAFARSPEDVWSWYLYRRGLCRRASPNPSHEAIARLEAGLGDRFVLITQNVDGLHLRAGSSRERTYQIHGNIDFLRSAERDGGPVSPIPNDVDIDWAKDRRVSGEEVERLRCPITHERGRPHVLWFDETYDEENFRYQSSLEAAGEAELIIIVGTSAQTNLPVQVAKRAARRGATFIAVNPEPSLFTAEAERLARGLWLESTAGASVPAIVNRLLEAP
jgi:NAD-dependent deacetylase